MFDRSELLGVIKTIIDSSGLTQAEVVRRTGISSQTISAYYHGERLPNIEYFFNICEVCGIDNIDLKGLSLTGNNWKASYECPVCGEIRSHVTKQCSFCGTELIKKVVIRNENRTD